VPSAQKQQRRDAGDRHHVAVLSHEKRGEFHAAVFGMESGDQFVFGFREVEGHAIGFGEGRDHKQNEADDVEGEDLEDGPPGKETEEEAGLAVDNAAETERVQRKQRRGNRQRHRQLVTDHLRRAAESTQQRIFII
jgi:hypothetical protein